MHPNTAFHKSNFKISFYQEVQLRNSVMLTACLLLHVLPPVDHKPVLQAPPEPLPVPSRVRGSEPMSTDIASHRHARRRFGMKPDAYVLAHYSLLLHSCVVGFCSLLCQSLTKLFVPRNTFINTIKHLLPLPR